MLIFKKEDIVFPEETLEHIISNYTEKKKVLEI